jgi:voltage-dependent potassium channel beta subunit
MEMEYRNLGRSGLRISALSFGAWLTFGDRALVSTNEKLMHVAYDAGVNFFDNAEGYAAGAAEEVMGEILARTGWRRDSYVLSSKAFFGAGAQGPTQRGLSRKHMVEACHAALRRLRVEYLDLYYCHRPDPLTPVDEVVWTMNDLMRQGKIFYWGTSEWSAKRIAEAAEFARENHLVGPTMEQPQYNILCRERLETEYAPLYEKYGLGTTVWSPLGSGLLTGKYNNGIPEGSRLSANKWLTDRFDAKKWDDVRKRLRMMGDFAAELGVAQSTLAIAWCLKNPRVSSVILGATRPEQLTETLRAVDAAKKLDAAAMKRIDVILPQGIADIADK